MTRTRRQHTAHTGAAETGYLSGERHKPAEVVSGCTRTQAIKRGILADVKWASVVGFKAPVAFTRAVWDNYVELTPTAKEKGTTTVSRLYHILWMLRGVIARLRNSNEEFFEVCVRTDRSEPSTVTLRASSCPDEHGRWSITVLLLDEDDPVTEEPG